MENNQVQCVSCHHSFNKIMKACPFCGAEKAIQNTNKEADCPVCRVKLDVIEFNGESVSSCPNCKGFWLNKIEFEILTSERNTTNDNSIPKIYVKQSLETRSNYLKCPICENLMLRTNFGRISGIIIDICGDHGAWFDPGELDQIRAFVANSGLQKAQDKQIENSKQEIDLLKYKVQDLELMEKILHKWKIKRIRFRKI